jgi:nucleotide-binding universal stress UspA family protein
VAREGDNDVVRRLVQILGTLPCDVVALDHVRRLAKLYTARVHLTAVFDPTAPSEEQAAEANGSRTWLGDVLTSAEVRLKLEGVPAKVELIRGEIGWEAVRVADLADLMVLALPRRGSMDAECRFRTYLAKQLCKHAPRPLFLARGEAGVPRNILVAYDGSSAAGHALRIAADLAERANATLHLLVATSRDHKLVGSHWGASKNNFQGCGAAVSAAQQAGRLHHKNLFFDAPLPWRPGVPGGVPRAGRAAPVAAAARARPATGGAGTPG